MIDLLVGFCRSLLPSSTKVSVDTSSDPAILMIRRIPRLTKQETKSMSDLSVAEKNIGNWLSQHASALTAGANVLKTVLAVIPSTATEAVSGVISGLEGLAANASVVATNVTSATVAVTEPQTLATIENALEQEAFAGAAAAAKAAFDDLMAGKPVAVIEQDALTAGASAFGRGTAS